MIERFELRLCSNGSYYVWNNNILTDISFDKFNKEDAEELIKLLNKRHDENQLLRCDNETLKSANKGLHKQSDNFYKEIQRLNKLIELIADAHSYRKEESVKDILRHEISAIDTVAGESAQAWNEYCILSDFFKKHFGEHWDNED